MSTLRKLKTVYNLEHIGSTYEEDGVRTFENTLS
jgi:hypothetical protein